MVVHGDPKDGAGLHMVEIAALKEDGKKVPHNVAGSMFREIPWFAGCGH